LPSRVSMELLSLSKKSQWPILIILAPLKINNLQATENRKMPGFKVFRQPRYMLRLPQTIEYPSLCSLSTPNRQPLAFTISTTL